MPEVSGTVKAISKSGKGIILAEYDDQWFNRGRGFEGAWPALKDEEVTLTYEINVNADGTESFFVLEAWPKSGGRPTPPTGEQPKTGPVPTSGPKPTAGPTPTNGQAPPAPTGPVPTPPSRENAILFQVCLKAAQEWVLATEVEGNAQRSEGHVLYVADLYYVAGLKLILGEPEQPQDGDPGPGEPA